MCDLQKMKEFKQLWYAKPIWSGKKFEQPNLEPERSKVKFRKDVVHLRILFIYNVSNTIKVF